MWCRAHSTHCLGAQGGRAAEDGAQKRKRGDDEKIPDLVVSDDEVSDDEDDATGRRRGMPGGRVDGRRQPISKVTVCSALTRALASTCKNVWNCPDSALLLRILQEPCVVRSGDDVEILLPAFQRGSGVLLPDEWPGFSRKIQTGIDQSTLAAPHDNSENETTCCNGGAASRVDGRRQPISKVTTCSVLARALRVHLQKCVELP